MRPELAICLYDGRAKHAHELGHGRIHKRWRAPRSAKRRSRPLLRENLLDARPAHECRHHAAVPILRAVP